MGSSRFWLKDADEESKSIPQEFPRSHWLKATGQCVIERYLSATMGADQFRTLVSMATGSSHRVIMGKTASSSFLECF